LRRLMLFFVRIEAEKQLEGGVAATCTHAWGYGDGPYRGLNRNLITWLR
jgi:hypothetical protein